MNAYPAVLVVLLCCTGSLFIVGCGESAPPRARGPLIVRQPAQSVDGVRSPNERGRSPTTSPGTPRAGMTGRPQVALRAFGEHFINWSSDNIDAVQHHLAQQAVDSARSMLLDAATTTAPELRAQGASNHGEVRSVSRDLRDRDSWIVVTRETSERDDDAFAGVGAQWHLTIASVRRLASGRWAVSSWSPQN